MNTDQKKQDTPNIPLKEKLKSIPEVFGIRVNEEPDYKVLSADGDFEIRRYSEQLVAKVSFKGMPFESFRSQAFKKLAAYIFQGNDKNVDIPMTSPVIDQHNGGVKTPNQIAMKSPVYQEESEDSGWTMSFILPKEFNLSNAPRPLDSKVIIEEVLPYEVAVISYSGNNTLEQIKLHERKLADWIKDQPQVHMKGRFMVAQYDAPFVIPFLKRNEIQVRIETIH
jgi:hypothetical protein